MNLREGSEIPENERANTRARGRHVTAVVALSPLLIAVILLVISLASELSYDDLCRAHLQYGRTLKLMDVMDDVMAKLEIARSDLKDYAEDGGRGHHPANPTHAAVNIKRARRALEKALDGNEELRESHRLLGTLHKRLKKDDVLRGQHYYERRHGSSFDRIRDLCTSSIYPEADFIPQPILAGRKTLHKWSKRPLRWAIVSALLGLALGIAWISDLKERMHVQSLRDVLRRRRQKAGSMPPEDLV